MAELEPWLIENYEQIAKTSAVADPYGHIADKAEQQGAPDVAAWARKRAKETGKNVTPAKATTAPTPQVKR